MKIIVICGKARSGKDTTASIIKEKLKNKKVINLQYSYYIKRIAKTINNWDGKEETKPRELLQKIGTEVKNKIDNNFFVDRMINDIKVYSLFCDYITISDARYKTEVDNLKKVFDNVVSIHITRPNFDNGLTEKEKMHATEVDFDDYNNFDYEIINDSLDDLTKQIDNIVSEVNNYE